MSAYDIICRAIQNRTSISAYYDGYHRVLSPHAIGTAKTGAHINVHSVQTGGFTSNGPIGQILAQNWKCMHLEKLVGVAHHDDPWQTAGNRSRPAWCIQARHYAVDY